MRHRSTQPNVEACSISLYGDSAVLLTFSLKLCLPVQKRLLRLCSELKRQPEAEQLRELVPGIGNLLLQVQPGCGSALLSLLDRVDELWESTETAPIREEPASSPVEIEVNYGGSDGPDLAGVAKYTGLTETEVIHRHLSGHYVVCCLGFQPGFAYLGGLDERLATPRRDSPRLRVPPGSVAIGGSQTAVYPAASPGGWHIIGRTAQSLFDSNRERPSLLMAGDRVRFVLRSAP